MYFTNIGISNISYKDYLLQVDYYLRSIYYTDRETLSAYYMGSYVNIQNILLRSGTEFIRYLSDLFIFINSRYVDYILFKQNTRFNSEHDTCQFINNTILPVIHHIIQLNICLYFMKPLFALKNNEEFDRQFAENVGKYLTTEKFEWIKELANTIQVLHS